MTVTAPTSDNLLLKIEDLFSAVGPELMINSGDHRLFSSSGIRFSLCASDENGVDRQPVVRPDGLRNGCRPVPAVSAAADAIDVNEGSAWFGGSLVNIPAVTGLAVPRPAAGNVMQVSIVADGAGSLSVLAGIEGVSFAAARGSAGGLPFVPVDKVETGFLKLSSAISAPVKENEIVFAPEFSHSPGFDILPYTASALFRQPLPLIHAGSAPKKVYVTFSDPQTVLLDVVSFSPPVMQTDYDPATGRLDEKAMKPGKMTLAVSGVQSDLVNRINGSVRLLEFMRDSTGTRKELYYALVETAAEYRPESVITAEASLTPVQKPRVETV